MLLATNGCVQLIWWLTGRTIDALRGPNPTETVPWLAAWVVGVALAQALVRIASRVALFNAARMAEYQLRSDLFAHLLRLEPAFYRKHPTGDIMSRVTSDVQTVRAMWGPGILNLANTAFAFVPTVVVMLLIDPILTLWALLPYPCILLLGRFFGRRIYKASSAVQETLGAMTSTIQEDLTGMGVIKHYSLEAERQRHFRRASSDLLQRNMGMVLIRGLLMPVLGGLASVGTVMVIWVGGNAVISGRMSLGELTHFNGLLLQLIWPTLALGWMISLFQRGLASWQRLAEILDTAPSITSGPHALNANGAGTIELRNLTITAGDRTLLDNVSLTIPGGATTAIVGRTGCGKTTLVETIPRLLEPPPGTVFLDDQDVTQLKLDELRGSIAYAPQDAYLFSSSIADNILFARTQSRDTGDPQRIAELTSAIGAAGLENDLTALPNGYDTLVGERGITLSGGQRQRVALARALAANHRVVILDDSLSSVDAATERTILEQLTDVLTRRTAIVISHRVAAVKRAQQIIVLDEGHVVESGNHNELLANNGLYAELYKSQITDADLTEASRLSEELT